MHVYSINSKARETVTTVLVVLALAVSIMVAFRFSWIKDCIYSIIFTDPNTAEFQRIVFEGFVSFICPISVYGILQWLYNRILWKMKIFKKWHHIPDLSGRWTMELTSAMKSRPREIEVEVRQDWNKLSVRTRSHSGTEAVSDAAAIEIDESQIRFRYAYTIYNGHISYAGFNTLNYDSEKDELHGIYFSAKTFGNSELEAMCGPEQKEECVKKLQDGVGSKGKMTWRRGKA